MSDSDRITVLARIQKGNLALQDASPELRNDPEIVVAAVKQNSTALQFASPQLRQDLGFMSPLIQRNGLLLQYASEELRHNRTLVLTAIQQTGEALRFATPGLRDDPDVVLAAMHNYSLALQYAGPTVRDNPDIVLAAVQKTAAAIHYASPRLRDDPTFILSVVQRNGTTLDYISSKFRNDKEIVLAAVRQHRGSLIYASKRLQEDPDVVSVAKDPNTMDLTEGKFESSSSKFPGTSSSDASRSPRDVNFAEFDRQYQSDPGQSVYRSYLKQQQLEDQNAQLLDRIRRLETQIQDLLQGTESAPVPKIQMSLYVDPTHDMVSQVTKKTQSSLKEPEIHLQTAINRSDIDSPPDEASSDTEGKDQETPNLPFYSVYLQYIQNPPTDLQYGQWISITGPSLSDVKIYDSFQQAADHNDQIEDWYCDQYRGPSPEPYLVSHAMGTFGSNSKRPSLAYVTAKIVHPSDEKSPEVQLAMMLDTGAEVNLGRPGRVDIAQTLKLKYVTQGQIRGITEQPLNVKYLMVKIEVPSLPAVKTRIAYPVIYRYNNDEGNWILGQEFLGQYKHTWNRNQKVKIEFQDVIMSQASRP